MVYESRYEKFVAVAPGGQARSISFEKAGRLAAGDQPELYFFNVAGNSVVVGISGAALERWQRSTRYLSREEKIDVAGLCVKQQVESGQPVDSEHLYIREPELDSLLRALGL